MKRVPLWIIGLLLLSGCGRLDSIPYQPQQTAETWLASQPFVSIKVGSADIILVQPSSTVLVYLLGIVAISAGLYIWRIRDNHRSRMWWGIALLLWGIWLWLGITLGAYFVYLVLAVTQELWARGVWFSENDVLHIGLILWMIYLGLVVAKRVVDAPASTMPWSFGGRR